MLEETSVHSAYSASIHVSHRERNPGVTFDLGWVESAHVNRSAVERRAATLPARGTDVDAMRHFGPAPDRAAVEAASVGNLKQTWVV